MVTVFIIILMSGMGFGLVLPPFMFAATNMGASPMFAAAVVSTFAVGQFIATPIWGRLSDRFGRKPMLLITMLGSGLAYLVMAYATNLWILMFARFLTGLLAGNFAVATAYVSDITPADKRVQGMGFVGGAVSLGFMTGPAIGGLLAGADAETASLYLPSLAAAAICLLTFIAIFLFLKESLPPDKRVGSAAQHAETESSGVKAFAHVLRRPILVEMVVMGFLVFFAMAMFETIFPLWSEARFDWGPRNVGFMFMYLGFVVMIVQMFLAGKLAPIFGEAKLLMGAVVAYAFGLILMTQVPSWQLMMIGITFTAGAGAMFNTIGVSWVSHHAGESERGLVIGVYQSAGWFGRSFGPTVSGLLFQAVSLNSPLYVGAMMMLPCFIIVLMIRRRSAAMALVQGQT
jgi:DHA1 family tetracycline resistance protein-like MFS transporter